MQKKSGELVTLRCLIKQKLKAIGKNALQHLQLAKSFWNQYATIYSTKNKVALYNRVGYVDVEKLKTNVQQDIDMVVKWKPGQNQLIPNGNTEVPFKQ